MAENDAPKRIRCPFCGDTLTEVVGNEWEENLRVSCIGCLAQSGRYRTRTEAIKAWNTRADLAAPDAVGLLMKVRAALELLLHPIRTVRQDEPDDASIPVQLRAGDIKQAREALRQTADDTYKMLSSPDAVRQARRETWEAAIEVARDCERQANAWRHSSSPDAIEVLLAREQTAEQVVNALEAAALRAQGEKGE